MDLLLPIIGLVIGVLIVNAAAARWRLPAPILLVVTGFAVSFVPGIPGYQLSPEFVLSVLLPPLLFGAAFESSAVAIKKLLRPIFQLAVVLVLLTAFSVAWVLTLVVPGMPLPVALALGAIVAPPDAVAAVAVARRVGLPRQLVTVLEGESLFNDATSLILLKVSIVAIGTASVSWLPAVGEFAWAAVGGVLIGGALGLILSFVRRKAQSPLTITALSLISPFAAYLLGEAAHASGVLVVVVTGLVLGYRSPTEVAASVRLTESATWAALRYVLEGAVFALIGLQLRAIVGSLDTNQQHVFLAIAAVLIVVIVSRPFFLMLIHLAFRLAPGTTQVIGARGVAALSWAGMRGVVSLAAAQTLPESTPFRSLLLVSTIAVIIGTLVLQGLSLPWVIRALGVAHDHRADDLRERAEAHAQASSEINARVDDLVQERKLSDRQADLMRKWASLRDWRNWDDDAQSRAFGQRLSVLSDWRRSLLGIERSVIVGMRNEGELSEDVLREMQHDLDLEEALLERRSDAVDSHLDELHDAGVTGGDSGTESADLTAQSVAVASDGRDLATPGSGADPESDPPAGDSAAFDQGASVDAAATVDDADVTALLMDESRAGGLSIGRRARRPTDG